MFGLLLILEQIILNVNIMKQASGAVTYRGCNTSLDGSTAISILQLTVIITSVPSWISRIFGL